MVGSIVIIIKKRISKRIIQRIPKSNILPQPTNNQAYSIEMATFHSTPRIIQVGLTRSPFSLNNSKNNKNIITSFGLFIIGIIFYISSVLNILSKFGWITLSNELMYHFIAFCCAPVLLSTIYFTRNPKHLISVLQDHNLM